jgi:hypothetical protein
MEKKMYRFMKVIALFGLILLSACQPGQTSVLGKQVEVGDGAYTEINVNELQSMLESKDFVLVNVHIPFEGDIPDTDVSIPFDGSLKTWTSCQRIRMQKSCSTVAVTA